MSSQQQQSQGEYPSQDDSSRERSAESSATPSRPGSTGPHESRPRERPRVRFTAGGESLDYLNNRSTFDVRDTSQSPSELVQPKLPPKAQRSPTRSWIRTGDGSYSPPSIDNDISADISKSSVRAPVSKQRPSVLRNQSSTSESYDVAEQFQNEDDNDEYGGKVFSQVSARERAQRLARAVGSQSPVSRRPSPAKSFARSPSPPSGHRGYPAQSNDIPLVDLNRRDDHSADYYSADEDTDEDDEGPARRRKRTSSSEAHRLVRAHTKRDSDHLFRVHAPSPGQRSGQVTPIGDRDPDAYVPPPRHYRGGILSSLLKLYNEQGLGSALGDMPSGSGVQPQHHHRGSSVDTSNQTPTPRGTPHGSPDSSGRTTPKLKHQKWYDKSPNHSTNSLSGLISSSTVLAQPGGARAAPKLKQHQALKPPKTTNPIGAAINRISKPRLEDEIRITVHIAETLSRQKFLVKLCRALMNYGAPTHRLEGEYGAGPCDLKYCMLIIIRVHENDCACS